MVNGMKMFIDMPTFTFSFLSNVTQCTTKTRCSYSDLKHTNNLKKVLGLYLHLKVIIIILCDGAHPIYTRSYYVPKVFTQELNYHINFSFYTYQRIHVGSSYLYICHKRWLYLLDQQNQKN